MYAYFRQQDNTYTVSFFDPNKEQWIWESFWYTPEDAARRVSFLNGGERFPEHGRNIRHAM